MSKLISCLTILAAAATFAEAVPSYDVIVAGGGPAGIGAGYAAASHEALASCRVMGNAMATGVGAGAAAAQAVEDGIDVRAVDARKLNLFK